MASAGHEIRRNGRIILQASVAATVAYAVGLFIGHEQPFFAPIAAMATVAVSLGNRLRRSAELLLGNAVGILLADFLIAEIGTGIWQLGLVVALALSIAIALGGGPILVMQSSSAAILIATILPPTTDKPFNTGRFIDALIGGGVGLVVSALLMPVDPARHTRQATEPLIKAISNGFQNVAHALRTHDRTAAERTLADLRATSGVLIAFREGLDATRESVRLAPWYWGQRALLANYALAGTHLDNALRNLRVAARQTLVSLDRDERVPLAVADAFDLLALAAEKVGPVVAGEASPDQVLRNVVAAVALTRSVATPQTGLFSIPLVAQVRLCAADLLLACALTATEATSAIRAGDPGPELAPTQIR